MTDLRTALGQIDIYLLDQVLRGRIVPGDTILDAGCGYGRNLTYFLREGYPVHAVDADEDAMSEVRGLAADLAPSLPSDNFHVAPLEDFSFPNEGADVVVSSAVLHFARDDRQFDAMLAGSWRPLRSGGVFFAQDGWPRRSVWPACRTGSYMSMVTATGCLTVLFAISLMRRAW